MRQSARRRATGTADTSRRQLAVCNNRRARPPASRSVVAVDRHIVLGEVAGQHPVAAAAEADRDRLSIWFGGIRVAHKGARDPDYDEAAVSAAMKKPEIALKVALGLGKGCDRVLTCDLTKEYVAINGDYRS